MFGDVVMGMEHSDFEAELSAVKKAKGVELDTDLDADDLQEVVRRYKEVYKRATQQDFPQDPLQQLWASINAVFGSWNNPRAIHYRRISDIRGIKGTGVNVQSMVFGNFGDTSGTGVCFSRDPSTGERVFYGEYLINAQGEDVVAGIRTPQPIDTLARENQEIYTQLVKVKDNLETHYQDMQDMEFTIQEGKLFLLQTRNGKRTGAAAVRIAVEMVEEGLIDKEKAIQRVFSQPVRSGVPSDDRSSAQERACFVDKGAERVARSGNRQDCAQCRQGRGVGRTGHKGYLGAS